MRWNLIARNPARGTTRPRADKAEIRVLSPDASEFLRGTTARPNHALYVLANTTGIRQGEILGLRWPDVDLRRNRIEVRRALQQQKARGLVLVELKTAGSLRRIANGGLAAGALTAQRDPQAFVRARLGDEWINDDLGFCTNKGTPLDPGWIREAFAADLKLAPGRSMPVHAGSLLASLRAFSGRAIRTSPRWCAAFVVRIVGNEVEVGPRHPGFLLKSSFFGVGNARRLPMVR